MGDADAGRVPGDAFRIDAGQSSNHLIDPYDLPRVWCGWIDSTISVVNDINYGIE